MMIFADLSAGDSVFVDANSLIYHFAPDPVLGPPCGQLLQRIENQELGGFTSIHLLSEVAHKLMTIEANALLGWPFAGMVNRLRRHPAEVQRLTASGGRSRSSRKVAFRSSPSRCPPWLPPRRPASKPAYSFPPKIPRGSVEENRPRVLE
jgi:hypothetical protein